MIIEDIDFELLFNKLIILPADKLEESTKQAKSEVLETTAEPTVENIVNESASTIKSIPFTIITTPDLKERLLKSDSNFRKIIQNKQIDQVANYISTQLEVNEELAQIQCIWSIGLSPSQEQMLLKLKHPNILISPNVEELKTKEEKLAMFNPFTAFVSTNSVLFSQI